MMDPNPPPGQAGRWGDGGDLLEAAQLSNSGGGAEFDNTEVDGHLVFRALFAVLPVPFRRFVHARDTQWFWNPCLKARGVFLSVPKNRDPRAHRRGKETFLQ